MNRFKCISLSLLTLLLGACSEKNQSLQFEGLSYSEQARLRNPQRGLRYEIAVDLVEDAAHPTQELHEQLVTYKDEKVTLAQTYFYLTNLIEQELGDKEFAVMQEVFDEFEKLGIKSVLRFAYERDFNGRYAQGPMLEQALAHLDQLKPFLEKNKHLILVVQAGVIGAWGEWHSSVHGLDQSDEAKRAILEKLLEVVPQELAVQVRVPEYKNLLKDAPESYKRISFHDDMIIIQPHKWDGGMHEGTDFFDQMVAETPYLPMDGELPWGFWSVNQDPDSPDPGWIVDGHQAARRFFLQHFTSLSVIHNYLEARGRVGQEDEVKYSMQVWQDTRLNPNYLRENKMPISDHYFLTAQGDSVQRNVFDYVVDHLGYRLELQELQHPAQLSLSQSNPLTLSLINRGFSTIHNPCTVGFVLVDAHQNVYELGDLAVNTFDWQPYEPADKDKKPLIHTLDASIQLNKAIPTGQYQLGLWIADGSKELRYDAKYAIQCANNQLTWFEDEQGRYGINLLLPLEVVD